jgi:hypothetical protein
MASRSIAGACVAANKDSIDWSWRKALSSQFPFTVFFQDVLSFPCLRVDACLTLTMLWQGFTLFGCLWMQHNGRCRGPAHISSTSQWGHHHHHQHLVTSPFFHIALICCCFSCFYRLRSMSPLCLFGFLFFICFDCYVFLVCLCSSFRHFPFLFFVSRLCRHSMVTKPSSQRYASHTFSIGFHFSFNSYWLSLSGILKNHLKSLL